MGPPVSVTAANLVMEDVEKRALSTYPLPLPFWKRYVCGWHTNSSTPRQGPALPPTHLNSIETTIQFTVKMEYCTLPPWTQGSLNTLMDPCQPQLRTSIHHHAHNCSSRTHPQLQSSYHTSVIYLRPFEGYWPYSGFAHPSGPTEHFGRRWWGWKTTYPYIKELMWFTKSHVVCVSKCTLAKWAGPWNTAWRSTRGH